MRIIMGEEIPTAYIGVAMQWKLRLETIKSQTHQRTGCKKVIKKLRR